MHSIAQLHYVGPNAIPILHFLSLDVLHLVIKHLKALLVQLFRLLLL